MSKAEIDRRLARLISGDLVPGREEAAGPATDTSEPHYPFLRSVKVVRERIEDESVYPFAIPAVRALDGLELANVTYLVGENGCGKSTVLEAIAVACGFNPEGGTVNFNFATRSSESPLHRCVRVVRGPRRPWTGFFLRAESFFNLATEMEHLDAVAAPAPPIVDSYGGRSLHEQSHGESFIALVQNRFGPEGLYILDEPEAALSPTRQLMLLKRMNELVNAGSQFIIATHAPIVLGFPGATIYALDGDGIRKTNYEETDTVRVTREFLANHSSSSSAGLG